ncbi:MAG: phosphate ABC transporter ATP-binding protein PstB [Sedimentisphaerales bacterium]|nr:phosphate ABC transporter ATP-binding protein PstB [Sedimentisphaerales bacterium]
MDQMAVKIRAKDLNLFYGDFHALQDIQFSVPEKAITALIGPSGCGKSTLLRCFNRMNDLVENCRITGSIRIDGQEVVDDRTDLIALRKKVGMVFQRPNVFDLSIYNNLLFGLRIHRMVSGKDRILATIRWGLEQVGLWDELKDRLNQNARTLTLEQQQRLCIARVVILRPEVILLDEPCSALDPIATMRIEELLRELKRDYTIVIVTHNMQQAARVSDYTGFMYLGRLIEFGTTSQVFTNPRDRLTENYISGQFG